MIDKYNRNIDYMRMSITDLCNLRCKYCMPEGMRVQKLPMAEILTYEELIEVAKAAVECGITKFKITGGEPLARKGCPGFIKMLKEISGVQQVTMTTNGVALEENLPLLVDAGLDAINISLDTLKADIFSEITGRNCHAEVIRGIEAAIESGIKVKLNTVLQRGVNDGEWNDIILFANKLNIDVRFIEIMPIGYGRGMEVVSNDFLRRELQKKYPDLKDDMSIHGNGPARYVKIPGSNCAIGFISAIHGKFCGDCNRIRLTATGKLKPCLCYGDTVDVKKIVRDNCGTGEISRYKRHQRLVGLIQEAILSKPKEHCFENITDITEMKKMVEIGG